MALDLTRALSRVRNVLILGGALVVAPPPAGPAAERSGASSAAPVIVVVRTGTLLREEVSPGSQGSTPEAWDLALTGTVLTAVESPTRAEATTLASLRAALFPKIAGRGGATGQGPMLLDLADTTALPRELVGDDRRKALPLRDLETLFGEPEPPTTQEADAVTGLQGSLRPGDGALPPAVGRLVARARLGELSAKPLSLVRLAAKGTSPVDVARRDGVLATLRAAAGDQGHLIVLNLPVGDSVAEGEGSAILRGPRVKCGWVVTSRVPLGDLAGLVETLQGRRGATSAGASPTPGGDARGGEEALRDVLR